MYDVLAIANDLLQIAKARGKADRDRIAARNILKVGASTFFGDVSQDLLLTGQYGDSK